MRHAHPGSYLSRTPRGRICRKKRPLHNITLPRSERKIFQQLDKEDFETGGSMDFNHNGLERATIQVGEQGAVDIDINPDYESDWHVHPDTGNKVIDKMNHFPSRDDIISSEIMPSQTMIIFHKGKATVAKKSGSFKPNNKIINEIEEGLLKDAQDKPLRELFKKYSPKYKKMGMEIKLTERDKDITIPAKIVEPKDKLTRGIWFDEQVGRHIEGDSEPLSWEELMERYKARNIAERLKEEEE